MTSVRIEDPEYHAKLSPSGADRWMACPGSVKLEEAFPDTPSAAAQEGTEAHQVAEDFLLGVRSDLGDYDLAMYIDFVRDLRNAMDPKLTYFERVESRLYYDNWVPEGSGTADYMLICVQEQWGHIVDLKYGAGVRVDALESSQGKMYLGGVLQEYDFLVDFKTLRFTIAQPRMDNLHTVEYEVDEIREFMEQAGDIAQLIYSDKELPLNPSHKACQWCRAKGACKAQAEFALSVAQGEFDVIA